MSTAPSPLFLPLACVLGLLADVPDAPLDVGSGIRHPVADVLAGAARRARDRLPESACRAADDTAGRAGEAAYLSCALACGLDPLKGGAYCVAEGAGCALCALGYASVLVHDVSMLEYALDW
jgi:hypothetical protein